MTMHRRLLGQAGEGLAAQYLRKKGYRILERNYRTRYGEIDIICKKGDQIVFVEVRSKRGNRFGTGAESVNWQKQQRVRSVAQFYLKQKQLLSAPIQFDVIDVQFEPKLEIVHIEHAF